MMVSLVLISILLNLFSMLAIIILYKRMSIYQQAVVELRKEVDNSYARLEKYMETIDHENQAFYDKLVIQLRQRQNPSEATNRKEQQNPVEPVESQQLNREEQLKRVEALVKQGYDEAHIVKALNTYKGEVQLMINMVRKAEQYGMDERVRMNR